MGGGGGGRGALIEVWCSKSTLGGWDGRLFEAGCLLTFSSFRVGAYSRWAYNRINTVRTYIFSAPRRAFQQPVYNKCKVRRLRVLARPL